VPDTSLHEVTPAYQVYELYDWGKVPELEGLVEWNGPVHLTVRLLQLQYKFV